MAPHPTENDESSEKKARLWLKISKTFPLDVQISDTIESVKDQIILIEGTSLEQPKLFFAGSHLENCKTLADYKISTNSTIDVHIEGIMQISIKIPSLGKTLKFDVYYMDTAQHLKTMIRDKAGLSLNQQLIVFCGKVLNDDQVLIACGVKRFSLLYVMLNPLAELLLRVQMSSGDSFSVGAMTGYTIGDVKDIIESLKGVPASKQKLFLDNLELLDSFILSSCKILHNSVIHLHAELLLRVQMPSGDSFSVRAMTGYTIADVKDIIESLKGVPASKQKLFLDNLELLDSFILSSCKILHNSVIHLQSELLLRVQMSSGDSFSVGAMTGYTIGDVKDIIESLKGVPASKQKLFLDNLELLDTILSSCKILHNSVIHLQVQMQIFVKIKTGKTITIEVEESDTIAVTIAKIQSKTELKREYFKFIYAGKVLQDHENLAFYGIKKESEIIMIPSINCVTNTCRKFSSQDNAD